jgi:UDP-GlcNAc:undecaprenyl-phosphate/decaprenyl-phosphate GlcNAc-1-phosphate transferase
MIYLVKSYAFKLSLIDKPNARSIHSENIPRGAGIGFVVASMLVLPLFHPNLLWDYSWVFLAIALVFAVGVLDDHRDTSPRTKFLIIAISTLLLCLNNLTIDKIGFFLGSETSLGWLALPFTLFAVIAFTNALNLTDGMDGLAGTISLIILATLFVVGFQNNDFFIMSVSGAFIGALIGFLLFNWHPATIFMGDSGSLTLGFVIALLSIKSLAYISAFSILFIAAIPIIDTTIVVIRRRQSARPIFAADRCHLHHILYHFFQENTRKTVLMLALLQLVYSLVGMRFATQYDGAVVLGLFILNIVLIYILAGRIIMKREYKC